MYLSSISKIYCVLVHYKNMGWNISFGFLIKKKMVACRLRKLDLKFDVKVQNDIGEGAHENHGM